MKITTTRKALGMLAALSLATTPGLALGQDTSAATIKGMIISHTGSTIVVRTGAGDMPVTLTDTTKIRGTTGVLGIRGDDHPATDLIRGLAVEVTAAPSMAAAAPDTAAPGAAAHPAAHGVTATEVTFKNSDLKTAQQISAGLVTTDANVSKNAAGIAENSQRIDDVGKLVPAGRTKVFFASGSTVITANGKEDLQAIAAKANGLGVAYRLAVVGRADTTGNAAANQRLSDQRAAAVKSYLMESCGVSAANFLPAAGLGSAPVAQDPDPPANAAEARRVTVTIAVSKSSQPGG